MMTATTLGLLIVCCASLAALLGVYAAARVQPVPRPSRGPRAARRRRALLGSPPFRLLEPTMRRIAGWLEAAELPTARQRLPMERWIRWSDQYLGLSAVELLSLTLLAMALGGLTSALVGAWLGLSPSWAALITPLAAALPWLSLRRHERDRRRAIERRLPQAIDLAVLCVGAGMDLRSSLDLICRGGPRDALTDELDRVLAELAMGRTREQALRAFAARVRSPAVRDFTAAVVQAELKGTPLAEALRVQARLARGQRSIAAEEAAARASVMLTLPLLLLLCCVLLLMFGPFLLNDGGF